MENLKDVSQLAKQAGFKYYTAITESVEKMIQKAVANKRCHNDYTGVLWDILWMARLRNDKGLYRVKITGLGRQKLFTFKLHCLNINETPVNIIDKSID